jgi:hypothetical protein
MPLDSSGIDVENHPKIIALKGKSIDSGKTFLISNSLHNISLSVAVDLAVYPGSVIPSETPGGYVMQGMNGNDWIWLFYDDEVVDKFGDNGYGNYQRKTARRKPGKGPSAEWLGLKSGWAASATPYIPNSAPNDHWEILGASNSTNYQNLGTHIY